MSRVKYLFSDMTRASIARLFPMAEALVLDIDPDFSFYDKQGPEELDKRLDSASRGLSDIGVPVSGKYPCRKMKGEDRENATVLILNGQGIDKRFVKNIADRAAGEGMGSYVCPIDEPVD